MNAPDENTEEITPEMLEAGYRVFVLSAAADYPLEADKLTIAEIYRAMRSAIRKENR